MIDEAIKKMQSLKPKNYKGLKNFLVQKDIELNVEHFLAHGRLIVTVRLVEDTSVDELTIKLDQIYWEGEQYKTTNRHMYSWLRETLDKLDNVPWQHITINKEWINKSIAENRILLEKLNK